ncbi:MAG TPA: hypothetical protein PLB62_14030 [Candidatus Sumerlaeota bacterium]|nr:hypothetical protein [Candidatus Sumerlaeota bacterium]
MWGKLVILSGPSCVGKGSLRSALARLRPDVRTVSPVLCHSRPPRRKKSTGIWEVHGRDYYFLPRGLFPSLDKERFLTVMIRSEYQAVDLVQLESLLDEHPLVLMEAYPPLAFDIVSWAAARPGESIAVTTVFLTPLSDDEIARQSSGLNISTVEVIYRVMKEKLLRRGEDTPEKIEERARYAPMEISFAPRFDHVLVCPVGEDDVAEWGDPLGPKAARVLEEFVNILES